MTGKTLGLVEPVSLTESVIDLDTVRFTSLESGTITSGGIVGNEVPSVQLLKRDLVFSSNGTTVITFLGYKLYIKSMFLYCINYKIFTNIFLNTVGNSS